MSQIKKDADQFAALLIALAPILTRVPNEVTHDERGFGLKLGGFYKDGTVTVRPGPNEGIMGSPIATVDGRYEELLVSYRGDDILKDIIGLAAERFRYWNSVKPEFDKIDANWLPILIEQGLVEEVKTVTYKIR